MTAADGKVTIPADKLTEPGQYTITAEKKDSNGNNILTYCVTVVTVKKAAEESPAGKNSVTFRLIGDAKHDGIDKHGTYVTWIATTTYTFEGDSVSVYKVFTDMLKTAGLSQVGADNNYVSGIQAPKAYGGYWLNEFSNGKNSGWMYTVNGIHPEYGLKDYKVSNGDSIVWHYVDDYKLETSFEGSVPAYPNRWLEAKDENPPTDKVIDMSGGNKEETLSVTQDITATVNKDGEATSKVTSSDVDKLIDAALKQSATTIGINVKDADNADKVSVELPKTSVSNIANKTDADLTVTTPLGKVTMDKNAMKEAVKAASGSDLTVVLEKQSIADESKDILGSSAAQTKVSILSGGKEITDLGTAKLKILLPVSDTLKDKTLAAAAVDADGSLTKIDGKTVTVDGKTYYQIETSKPGSFVVAESESIDAAIKAQAGETDEEKAERIKAGVEKTTIKLRSTFSKKNNIQLKWTKSKGYKVDYYEVFKSTKRFSGFGTKAYYKTSTGTKNTYINTKELKKGTRYFYKVRGVRVINGEKVYTQWSNKAWRISRVNRK